MRTAFAILRMGAAAALAAAPFALQADHFNGGRTVPVHRIAPLDAEGDKVSPSDALPRPVSQAKTCAQCLGRAAASRFPGEDVRPVPRYAPHVRRLALPHGSGHQRRAGVGGRGALVLGGREDGHGDPAHPARAARRVPSRRTRPFLLAVDEDVRADVPRRRRGQRSARGRRGRRRAPALVRDGAARPQLPRVPPAARLRLERVGAPGAPRELRGRRDGGERTRRHRGHERAA